MLILIHSHSNWTSVFLQAVCDLAEGPDYYTNF